MNRSQPSSRAAAPLRRAGRLAAALLVPFAGLVMAVLAVQAAELRLERGEGALWEPVGVARELLGTVGVFAVVALLALRHRRPVLIAGVVIGMEAVLPLGPVGALALPAALVHATRRQQILLIGGHLLATLAWATLDLLGRSAQTSAIRMLLAPPDVPSSTSTTVSVVQALLLLVLTVLLPVAVGLRLRQQHRLLRVESRVRAGEIRRDRLEHELAARAERERIAREVHDVLGHRLSLLSIHAGALEVSAQDERTRSSAALVRESAHGAMEDLRSLIGVLRDPTGGPAVQPAPTLGDVRRLLDEAIDSGSPIVATVFLEGVDDADPALSQAAYRIVQEMLTNARRHARDRTTRLLVEGSPGHGLRIESVNEAGPPAPEGAGRGAGLSGISERAALLGGEATSGPDGHGAFRTSVWIPWPARGAAS